jgi:hypothetical protein
MDICKKNTMGSIVEFNFLEKIINEINNQNILGDIVECGVWKGGMSMWMMLCQKKHNMLRNFFLYDTFDGMTFPDSINDGKEAIETYTIINQGNYARDYDKWHKQNKWAYAPLEFVKNNIDLIKYDDSKINYVVGDVCDTLNTNIPDKISILRLDTDFYSSTKKELDILFPLVSQNGYIIIDDYYSWEGSKKATDEFLEENKNNILMVDEQIRQGIFVFKKK